MDNKNKALFVDNFCIVSVFGKSNAPTAACIFNVSYFRQWSMPSMDNYYRAIPQLLRILLFDSRSFSRKLGNFVDEFNRLFRVISHNFRTVLERRRKVVKFSRETSQIKRVVKRESKHDLPTHKSVPHAITSIVQYSHKLDSIM